MAMWRSCSNRHARPGENPHGISDATVPTASHLGADVYLKPDAMYPQAAGIRVSDPLGVEVSRAGGHGPN